MGAPAPSARCRGGATARAPAGGSARRADAASWLSAVSRPRRAPAGGRAASRGAAWRPALAAIMLPPSSQPAGAAPEQPRRGSEPSRAGPGGGADARPARPRVTPGVEQPPQQYELRSGDARLLVRTDGTLVLLRGDDLAPAATGRAVVPWFVARQGARATVTNAAAASGRLEMRWGDGAVLRITATSHPDKPPLSWDQNLSDGFLVEFAVRPRPGAAHPRDMAELVLDVASAGHWYGGGHLMRQHWPLERGAWEIGPHYPFDNGPNGVNTLLGSHWVTSNGALVMVDPDTPYLHVGLNSPPPRKNWFLGGLRKISWGVGIQNFTRQILPLPAEEQRGDGLLHLQARSTYESRRIAHPLSSWQAPEGARAAGAGAGDSEAQPAAARHVLRSGAAHDGTGSALQTLPLAEEAAEGLVAGGDGHAGDVGALLHGFAHARDASAAASLTAAAVQLRPPTPAFSGAPGTPGEPAWLTVRATLCAKPDVKAATQAAHATLQRPPHGPLPELLRAPIWTSWARYKSGVTQAACERFAAEIATRNLPRSVLEIDDRWQASYGDLTFDTAKFPDARGMVSRLHAAGFKVTLWVMPFVEEGSAAYAEGMAGNYFVTSDVSAGVGLKPGFFRWWNTSPAVALDVTNPAAVEWFLGRLRRLQADVGIDGFKFDAGEPCFLPASFRTHRPLSHPSEYTRAWVTNVAAQFECAEVRTGHRTQHIPLLTRMGDRFSEWGIDNGLGSIVPTLLTSGVLGYPYCLPDMIGGNAYFGRSPNPELMVRWAQANALMPAVQFSIAPWDLSPAADALVTASLAQRALAVDDICRLAEEAAHTLAPICRPMWWLDPVDGETFAIDDQFALGDDIIVAPVVQRGATSRDVYLTRGQWRDAAHPATVYEGGCWLRGYEAPLEVLPVFNRVAVE